MNKNFISVLLISFLISCASVLSFANTSEKTLLIFSAKWCKFCQQSQYDIDNDESVSQAIKSYTIINIDFDKDKDLVIGHNIKSLPTFVIFQDGKEQKRFQGYRSKQSFLDFLQ